MIVPIVMGLVLVGIPAAMLLASRACERCGYRRWRFANCAKCRPWGLTSRTVEVRESPIHGVGLFTRIPRSRGAIVSYLLGRTRRTHEPLDDHAVILYDSNDHPIHLDLDVNCAARYMNHADPPNCTIRGAAVVTLRAVAKDEELTIHYGDDWE